MSRIVKHGFKIASDPEQAIRNLLLDVLETVDTIYRSCIRKRNHDTVASNDAEREAAAYAWEDIEGVFLNTGTPIEVFLGLANDPTSDDDRSRWWSRENKYHNFAKKFPGSEFRTAHRAMYAGMALSLAKELVIQKDCEIEKLKKRFPDHFPANATEPADLLLITDRLQYMVNLFTSFVEGKGPETCDSIDFSRIPSSKEISARYTEMGLEGVQKIITTLEDGYRKLCLSHPARLSAEWQRKAAIGKERIAEVLEQALEIIKNGGEADLTTFNIDWSDASEQISYAAKNARVLVDELVEEVRKQYNMFLNTAKYIDAEETPRWLAVGRVKNTTDEVLRILQFDFQILELKGKVLAGPPVSISSARSEDPREELILLKTLKKHAKEVKGLKSELATSRKEVEELTKALDAFKAKTSSKTTTTSAFEQ